MIRIGASGHGARNLENDVGMAIAQAGKPGATVNVGRDAGNVSWPSLRGAKRRGNPEPAGVWIASPAARNDGYRCRCSGDAGFGLPVLRVAEADAGLIVGRYRR